MVAFKKPAPGQPHPPPWKAVSGGSAFDVEGELYVPQEYRIEGLGRDTVWWLVAGLRVGATSLLAPVVSPVSFADLETAPDSIPLVAIESSNHLEGGADELSREHLAWYAAHWHTAGEIAARDNRFMVLVQAMDEAVRAPSPGLATIMIWGALEAIFARGPGETTYRMATSIAAYLEAPGPMRLARFDEAKKLYGVRSSAAHGRAANDLAAFLATRSLARSVVTRIVEGGAVPEPSEVLNMLLASGEPAGPKH
jgi:hypothetical protein